VKTFLKGLLWVVGILAIIVLILRLTLFTVWTVPDDPILDSSLRPTLASGDVVLLLTKGGRGFGALVRCTDPDDPQRFVVGRVAGLEGDEVEINMPFVSVNGTRYGTTDACKDPEVDVPHPTSGAPIKGHCSRVEMGGGWHFMVDIAPHAEKERKQKVGPGRLFLISDDRTFHEDSRDYGDVLASTCKEAIVFRLWSKSGFGDSEHRLTYIR
jgi:signal peptidase I